MGILDKKVVLITGTGGLGRGARVEYATLSVSAQATHFLPNNDPPRRGEKSIAAYEISLSEVWHVGVALVLPQKAS